MPRSSRGGDEAITLKIELLLSLFVVGAPVGLGALATSSAFAATTLNGGNGFTVFNAGSVTTGDADAGSHTFSWEARN